MTLKYGLAPVNGSTIEENFEVFKVKVPIELETIRLGGKWEIELLENLSVNTRVGVAYWEYNGYTPDKLAFYDSVSDTDKNGNDLYYSLGVEYEFVDNIYFGFEYSLLKINEKNVIDSNASYSFKHNLNELSLVVGMVF